MTSEARGASRRVLADEVSVPATRVTVYEALHRRRMAWRYTDAPVPREALERMLEAAVWAPNHRMTEPWRFFVLDKDSAVRRKAADLAYEYIIQQTQNHARAEAGRRKVLDPPVVLYAYCVPGPDEEVSRENYAAAMCALQNLSLASVAEGLAGGWETGSPTRHPKLKETLGAKEDWTLVAMVSVGVPAERLKSRRTPAREFVRWL